MSIGDMMKPQQELLRACGKVVEELSVGTVIL
jgi:hypothetical protein